MASLGEACRLNVDTLEAEVLKLKKNLQTTTTKLERSTEELKQQFSPFVETATTASNSLQSGEWNLIVFTTRPAPLLDDTIIFRIGNIRLFCLTLGVFF